jgi:hypothetical protein
MTTTAPRTFQEFYLEIEPGKWAFKKTVLANALSIFLLANDMLRPQFSARTYMVVSERDRENCDNFESH